MAGAQLPPQEGAAVTRDPNPTANDPQWLMDLVDWLGRQPPAVVLFVFLGVLYVLYVIFGSKRKR